jgi:chorismate dehydratase
VTLFSRVPWKQIRSLALDEGSRTSAALARILLQERYGVAAKFVPLPMDQVAEEMGTDAVLLIGDRAMRAALPGFEYSYDLGQEWDEWTGLPFVYAAWAVRPGVDLGNVAEALLECKRRGRERVAQIAYFEARRLGLDAAFCRRYLTNIICFDLGPRELAGLKRYYELACGLGLAPRGVELAMYQRSETVATVEA